MWMGLEPTITSPILVCSKASAIAQLRPRSSLKFACSMVGNEYLFYDESGQARTMSQRQVANWDELGEPLMPGLFAVGIHRALQTAHSTYCPGENKDTFLDETYIKLPG